MNQEAFSHSSIDAIATQTNSQVTESQINDISHRTKVNKYVFKIQSLQLFMQHPVEEKVTSQATRQMVNWSHAHVIFIGAWSWMDVHYMDIRH